MERLRQSQNKKRFTYAIAQLKYKSGQGILVQADFDNMLRHVLKQNKHRGIRYLDAQVESLSQQLELINMCLTLAQKGLNDLQTQQQTFIATLQKKLRVACECTEEYLQWCAPLDEIN